MSMAHMTTLYAVIIIYTVQSCCFFFYKKCLENDYKMVEGHFSELKTFQILRKLQSYTYKNKEKNITPPP